MVDACEDIYRPYSQNLLTSRLHLNLTSKSMVGRRHAALSVAVVTIEKYNVLRTHALVFVATHAPTRSREEMKTKMKWKRK